MIGEGLRELAAAARAFSADTRRFLAGVFLMGLGSGAMEVHLNLYLRALDLGETAIGRVLSAGSVGIVAVSIPAALWVERLAAGRIFSLAAAGFSACLLLMAFTTDPWALVVLSFAAGALFTVHLLAEGPFFMRSEGGGGRTELFGIAAAVQSLAVILSAFGTGVLARVLGTALGSEAGGLRWALVAAAALSLLAVVPYRRIRMAPAASAPRPWRAVLVPRDPGLMLRLSLPAFLVGAGAGLTIPFLNLYFRDRFGQDPASIGFYFSVLQVLVTAGFLAGPLLARRLGHVRAVVLTELLCLPFFLVMAITGNLAIAVMAFWMRGALVNMNQPVSAAFAMGIVPEDQRAVANSLRMFAWNVSWMVSTVVGGAIIEAHGHGPGMFATIGLYLVAAWLFWTFFHGRTVEAVPSPAPAGPGPETRP